MGTKAAKISYITVHSSIQWGPRWKDLLFQIKDIRVDLNFLTKMETMGIL